MTAAQCSDGLECETLAVYNEFKRFDDFISLLGDIETSVSDIRKEESLFEKINLLFSEYQEQPHLLDPYLAEMLGKCISLINKYSKNKNAQHFVFKVVHLMTKTRGYKSLISLMPHTVDDLEPVFDLLSVQDAEDRLNWQTRYVLLLWLSIVVMVPFGLDKLEKPDKAPLKVRVITEAKRHVVLDEVTQEAAAHLLAKFVSRPDVYPTELESILSWASEEFTNANYSHKGQSRVAGCLRSISSICKVVPRAVLLPHAQRLLQMTLNLPSDQVDENILLSRLRTKLVQRVGLIFCPRRAAAASWRYQRGFRSLADNLSLLQAATEPAGDTIGENNTVENSCGGGVQSYLTVNGGHTNGLDKSTDNDEEDEEDFDVPENVAEVIDNLIDALRSKFTYIRWSAAKGLGRICSRLTSPFVDDVLTAILSLCTRLETFAAWHGACFALAELGRRCLLLPEKLNEVIPVVLTALFYDEKSGDHNYGANVRDSACYCCWAFARAYSARDFAPHVEKVSRKLILATLFDRELNVRRAAAAAFQENVGRQGQFPHGIEIITTCDYFAVGNISNCYLKLSEFVAEFKDYTDVVIEHLAYSRLGHWDENLRDLAARALYKLAPVAQEKILKLVLPKLAEAVVGPDLYMRQGCILGIAELVHALSGDLTLPSGLLLSIKEILPKLNERNYFRGVTGELMRRACCRLIEKVSVSKLPFHEEAILETWRSFMDDCLNNREKSVQDPAVPAYAAFIRTYLFGKEGSLRQDYREQIRGHLLGCLNSRSESAQVGYLRVLGASPGFLFSGAVEETLDAVGECCTANSKTIFWGNARQAALGAITSIVANFGVTSKELSVLRLQSIYKILIYSLTDYTVDLRGDIGSVVREAGMQALLNFSVELVDKGRAEVILPGTMEEVVVAIAQQAVEKIDRTRAVAGKVFAGILHHTPDIPHVPEVDNLRRIFSRETCEEISWLAADLTFPLFVQLFDYPIFHQNLLLGFSVSVGGVTEKTVRASSDALREYIRKNEARSEFLLTFMRSITDIFSNLSEYNKICLSLLKFLDFLLCDPVLGCIMQDQQEMLIKIIDATWNEVHLSKEVMKLKAAIDVYGAMFQFPGLVCSHAASFLADHLRHRYPIIRKAAALKLFECLLIYSVVEPEASEELSNILTETVWENSLEELKPIRANICRLLNVPVTRLLVPRIVND